MVPLGNSSRYETSLKSHYKVRKQFVINKKSYADENISRGEISIPKHFVDNWNL